MSKDTTIKEVFLPKHLPDIVRASDDYTETDKYFVIDRRPKVGEWYINMYISEKARSIQNHRTLRALRNHQRDYRFKYCSVVIASNNPKFNLPSCNDYFDKTKQGI